MSESGTIVSATAGDSSEEGFWGEFEYNVDEKLRIVMPPEFRKGLGTEFVVTRWPEHSIAVFPMAVWRHLETKLRGPVMNKEQAYLRQTVAGSRTLVKLDAQFRLALPKHLREWSGINPSQTAVIVGQDSQLEIWSKSNWDKRISSLTYESMYSAASAVGLSELTGQ